LTTRDIRVRGVPDPRGATTLGEDNGRSQEDSLAMADAVFLIEKY